MEIHLWLLHFYAPAIEKSNAGKYYLPSNMEFAGSHVTHVNQQPAKIQLFMGSRRLIY